MKKAIDNYDELVEVVNNYEELVKVVDDAIEKNYEKWENSPQKNFPVLLSEKYSFEKFIEDLRFVGIGFGIYETEKGIVVELGVKENWNIYNIKKDENLYK